MYRACELSLRALSMAIVAASLTVPARGQSGAGLDLGIASKHVWRGQTYRNGWVVQPGLFAFRRWPGAMVTGGVWLHVEPFNLDTANGVGFGRTLGGEVNAWLDLGWRSGPLLMNAGVTGLYPRVEDAVGPAARRVRTHEIHVQAVLARPRLTPHAKVTYDIDAVRGAYAEAGLQYRVPLWTQVLLPVGSIFVRATAAWAIGQRTGTDIENTTRYFRDNGLTHVTFSAILPVGPFALGAASSSVAAAVHVQINADPYLEDVSRAVDAGGRAKIWLGLAWSLQAPRCRGSRGVCPTGSLP